MTCLRCTCALPAKLHEPGPKARWCARCQPFRRSACNRRYYQRHAPAVRAYQAARRAVRRERDLRRRRRYRFREAPP